MPAPFPAFHAIFLAWLSLAQDPAPAAYYAVTDVTVIDVAAGARVRGQTVLIRGETIECVGAANAVETPAGATRVDGAGLFLMPGLFDAHVHYVEPASFGRAMVANGVVAAREMGSFTAMAVRQREALRAGEMLGPELLIAGAIVDGKPASWPFSEPCATPDDGRAAVGKLARAKVDFIKVYSRLDRDTWRAVVEEAHARGLRVSGHVPEAVSVSEAAAAGMASAEHLMGFDRLIGDLLGLKLEPSPERPWAYLRLYSRLEEVPAAALDTELQRIARAGLVQVPTLVVIEGIAALDDPDFASRPEQAYIAPMVRSFWQAGDYLPAAPIMAEILPHMQELVRRLHAAGATIVTGSDLANPGVWPGFSVHREMELLAAAGLPADAVLRAATCNAARLFGWQARLGGVEAGKTASLLLLRRDPLADVSAVRDIAGVFLRGRYFDRIALDALLEQAHQAGGG